MTNYTIHLGWSGLLGLQTGLSAFWSLENTSWTDDTANGNTLTGVGSPTTTTGIIGNGFDGTAGTKNLTINNNSNLQLTGGNFSIQAWVKMSGNVGGAGASILSKNDGGFTNKEYGLGIDFTTQNVFTFWSYLSGGNQSQTFGTTAVNPLDNVLHHVVVTWDGTTVRMYVDNSSATTSTPASMQGVTTSAFKIGVDGDGGAVFIQGVVDQVGLWKGRTLSAGDVALLYNSGAGLSFAGMA